MERLPKTRLPDRKIRFAPDSGQLFSYPEDRPVARLTAQNAETDTDVFALSLDRGSSRVSLQPREIAGVLVRFQRGEPSG